MVAVPRKAGAPMSLANVRGVQCSNAAPRVVGKVLRRQLRDALVAQVGDLQSGAVPAMGTDIATFTLKLFMANARVRAVSAGAVFADLKSAFYSAWPELAVGPLLSGEQRQKLFAAAELTPLRAQQLEDLIMLGPSPLQQQQVKECWQALAADWHAGSHFWVPGAEKAIRTPAGVKPGDAVADLIFALVFHAVQKQVHSELLARGMLPKLVLKPGPFAPADLVADLVVAVPPRPSTATSSSRTRRPLQRAWWRPSRRQRPS